MRTHARERRPNPGMLANINRALARTAHVHRPPVAAKLACRIKFYLADQTHEKALIIGIAGQDGSYLALLPKTNHEYL